MTQELAISNPQQAITHYTLPEICKLGKIFADSGFFSDTRGEAQVITKILAGQELGFGAFASLNGIYIVKGKVTVGANLMAQRVKESAKYDYRVLQMEDTVCELQFLEKGDSIGTSQFTIEDAKKAGTQNTDKFARNMLFARAMSNGVRWYCPDVFTSPVYTPEEMGARVDGEGNVITSPVQSAALAEPALEGEVTETGEGISDDEMPYWLDRFLTALQGTPGESHSGLDKWIAGMTKGAAKDFPAFIETHTLDAVKSLLERAIAYGEKKRAEKAPSPMQAAIRDKVEEAKVGNAEEEKAFEQEEVALPSEEAATTQQLSAINAIAARVFGREERDEKVLALIQDSIGAKLTLDTLNKPEASRLIDLLRAQMGIATEGVDPVVPKAPEEAAPAKPKANPNMKRLMAIISTKGLLMDADNKGDRLRAVNAFLDEQGMEPIESFSKLDASQIHLVAGAIEDGVVRWGAPTEDVVEGVVET